jgi:hypothetical protein
MTETTETLIVTVLLLTMAPSVTRARDLASASALCQ